MGNGFAFVDIIILGLIAGFLILRLRSVLGKRMGHEEPSDDLFGGADRQGGQDDGVINLPGRDQAEEARSRQPSPKTKTESGAEAGLTQIALADRDFDVDQFMGGARMAFEMIVKAFADGDTKTLRPLLAKEVYEEFAGAIDEREKENQSFETELVAVKEVDIVDAKLEDNTASITVKFISDQINLLKDDEGRILEGDPTAPETITDVWTFARNVKSSDPNWTLIATDVQG